MSNFKLVYGIGINDANYIVQVKEDLGTIEGKRSRKTIWNCPFYSRWTGVLHRISSHKNYSDVTICDEWKIFSNFRNWMIGQPWENRDLDKDLRVIGSKVYSPETCAFIPHRVNSVLLNLHKVKGALPKGIYERKGLKKPFRVQVCDGLSKYRQVGYFETVDDAVSAWYDAKENAILDTLEWWYENDRESFRPDIFHNVVDIARNLNP